jgi:hypothetical protein
MMDEAIKAILRAVSRETTAWRRGLPPIQTMCKSASPAFSSTARSAPAVDRQPEEEPEAAQIIDEHRYSWLWAYLGSRPRMFNAHVQIVQGGGPGRSGLRGDGISWETFPFNTSHHRRWRPRPINEGGP